MMNLTIMGLDLGPLVFVLFIVALSNRLFVLEFFGRVIGVGSGIFVPTEIDSIRDVVVLFVL